jgi:hypothetical protein
MLGTLMTDYILPRGKHKGKRLSELNGIALSAMYGAYLDNGNQPEILAHLTVEMKRRKRLPKRPEDRWDGELEAERQTDAELAEIGARRGQCIWVGPWIGGSPDWMDHIPMRADQG